MAMSWNPSKRLLQIQIDEPVHEQIELLAELEGRSKAQQARFMLKEAIASHFAKLPVPPASQQEEQP